MLRRAARAPWWWALGAALLGSAALAFDAAVDPARVTNLTGDWAVREGDDPTWARPDLDDSGWERSPVPAGWGWGRGAEPPLTWYRRRLSLEPLSSRALGHLGVTLGKIDSAYELYAGGARLGGVGALPPQPRMEYDRHASYAIPGSAIGADGTLVLALRVWKDPATNGHRGAPVEGPYLIGPLEQLTRREVLSELPELVLVATFLIGGLLHLAIYRMRSEQVDYLYFGLVCLGTAGYTLLRSQWKWALGLPFASLKKAEHLLLYLMAILFTEFLWRILARPPARLVRIYQWANAVAALAILLTPGLWLALRLLVFWQLALLGATAAMLWLFVDSARHGHPDGRVLMVGLLALAATYLSDAALDRGFHTGPRLIPFGFLVFLGAMAIVLAQRFTREHRELQELRRDLTARVEERTRELAAANQAKDEFVANMSHEIRTPMNGVLGLARLLLETPLSSEQREYVELISRSGGTLLAVVNDVLDLAKIEAGRIDLLAADFDVRRAAQDALQSVSALARDKGLELRSSVAPDVPELVRGDAGRLGQVLSNLLGNAIKFTEHGSVSLLVRNQPAAAGEIRLRFEVADTGVGIAPELQARLFQRFSQGDGSRARGGTGLGLVICKRLVELMGGEIGVDSRIGAGSTFQFSLRLASAAGEPALAACEPAPPAPAGDHVLIVEDDPISQRVAVGLVAHLGHKVEVAGDAAAALAAFARGGCSVVLMDCQLPGTDGFEAARRMRQAEADGRRTPIIALTASVLAADRERCVAAGMDDFLAKPVNHGELEAALRRWIAPSAWRAEPAATGPTDGPLELDRLAELRAFSTRGFLEETIDLFLVSAPARLAEMEEAARRDDVAEVARLSHGFRGSCGLLGVREMARLLRELEEQIKSDPGAGVEPLLASLRGAYTRAREALVEERERPPTAPAFGVRD